MLSPRKTKYRKMQKGRRRGLAYRGSTINFGDYALMAMQDGYMTSRQIETVRVVFSRAIRGTGKIWIRVFPDKPITAKPIETRMGKGKGAPEYWVAVIKPGRILFEIEGLDDIEQVKKACKHAGNKLPFKTKMIAREGLI